MTIRRTGASFAGRQDGSRVGGDWGPIGGQFQAWRSDRQCLTGLELAWDGWIAPFFLESGGGPFTIEQGDLWVAAGQELSVGQGLTPMTVATVLPAIGRPAMLLPFQVGTDDETN